MLTKLNTKELSPTVGSIGDILITEGYLDAKDKDPFEALVEVIESYSNKRYDILHCEIKDGDWLDSYGDIIDTRDSIEHAYVVLWCQGNRILAHSEVNYDPNVTREYFFNTAETC